jgi:hypothetical protein
MINVLGKSPKSFVSAFEVCSLAICIFLTLSGFSANLSADTVAPDQQTGDSGQVDSEDEPVEVAEEININDPTAAAISVSAGW